MMMNQLQVNSKRVTFEPGNCTRYDFLISKVDEETWMAVDLINGKCIPFSDFHLELKALETHLVYRGYNKGDAEPMAFHFMKAIHENAYIKYKPCDGGTATRWFPESADEWQEHHKDIEQFGGEVLKAGIIW